MTWWEGGASAKHRRILKGLQSTFWSIFRLKGKSDNCRIRTCADKSNALAGRRLNHSAKLSPDFKLVILGRHQNRSLIQCWGKPGIFLIHPKMPKPDPYQVLGVSRTATQDEIKVWQLFPHLIDVPCRKRTASSLFSTIPIKIREMLRQKKNLRKLPKHTKF